MNVSIFYSRRAWNGLTPALGKHKRLSVVTLIKRFLSEVSTGLANGHVFSVAANDAELIAVVDPVPDATSGPYFLLPRRETRYEEWTELAGPVRELLRTATGSLKTEASGSEAEADLLSIAEAARAFAALVDALRGQYNHSRVHVFIEQRLAWPVAGADTIAAAVLSACGQGNRRAR